MLLLGAVAAVGAGFARAIGSEGAGNGQFNRPYGGVAFDGEGNLVVADSLNHRIGVFRYSDGAYLRSFGSKGAGAGQFNSPWGIAFDGVGHIIVSEYKGNRVQVLRYSDGTHVRTFGSQGSGNGQFSCPRGIAVDGEGNVAVFDGGNARVQVFRLSDGAYVRTEITVGSKGSGNGQFAKGDFSDCGIAFDSEGNLVVADSGNHRVQVLRYRDGAHVCTIGSLGAGAGQFQGPTSVAFDAAGHIVVVENGNHRVQVLRYSDGAHVRTIGSYGSGNGQFNGPFGGIAIDSDGRMVVADTSTIACKFSNEPPPPYNYLSPPPPPFPSRSILTSLSLKRGPSIPRRLARSHDKTLRHLLPPRFGVRDVPRRARRRRAAPAAPRRCGGDGGGAAAPSNYYHLSPHVRAHVLCAPPYARCVFLAAALLTQFL